ncbi:TPA: hypothetical protein ACGS6U_002954 [Escherichia coli]
MWKQKNTGADICERILLWMVHQRFQYGKIFLRIQNIASVMNMTAREVREYLDISAGSVGEPDLWTRPQLIVKARLNDGGDLVPGVKKVEVPLRIAQVAATNDLASINAALTWANANLYQTPHVSTTWIIQTTITPKC